MNTYNFNDENFMNSKSYKDFILENPEYGYLKIRAYAANSAIPISNLKIVISKIIGENNIIFYEGYTDSSGIIEKVALPAPKLNLDNMIKPSNTIYTITASDNNMSQTYTARMYENVCVIQDINIIPIMKVGMINGN